ncbi:hypothetical protein N8D55_23120 (plasmid) [Xanthomonas hortorum pv. pelargonii]|nr:hypothetical protein N8D55_23120 [Xanthomonas hortorum pv. pelargonii]
MISTSASIEKGFSVEKSMSVVWRVLVVQRHQDAAFKAQQIAEPCVSGDSVQDDVDSLAKASLL